MCNWAMLAADANDELEALLLLIGDQILSEEQN